jgi:hypothetical protein
MPYTLNDLHVIDPIALIRNNPLRFIAGEPLGLHIANQLARDILLLGSTTVEVRKIEKFWVISSQEDWLLDSNGNVSFEPFYKIIHFPAAGQNAMRNEVLAFALSQVLATIDRSGTHWIVERGDADLTENIQRLARDEKWARVLVFALP